MINLKIFLVEEDTQEALKIKETFESFGYSVLSVASPEEDVIARARDLMPDLIVMDLSFKEGLEYFQAPEEMENLNLPIIYLTTSAQWEDIAVRENISTDQDSYLIKPYDDVELKYAIELAIYKNFKKLKNYYKAIFEHTGTATIIIEEDTTISLANSEFEKLSGYSKEEIEGKKSWTEFASKEDLDKMKEYHRLRRIDPDSVPFIYDFRFVDREGTVKNVHMNIGMIPGTNKSVASMMDVTERKLSGKNSES